MAHCLRDTNVAVLVQYLRVTDRETDGRRMVRTNRNTTTAHTALAYRRAVTKNGWTDNDAVKGLIHDCPRNHVLDEVKSPHEKGHF